MFGPLTKFGEGAYEAVKRFSYSNIFQIEKTTGPDRLVIAPNENQIDILLLLAGLWDEGYFLLYILLVPRLSKREQGRYQSSGPLSFKEAEDFCTAFKPFLETDGRHHFWIGSANGNGTLVYDQHNVIYAYGDTARYIEFLKQIGFKEDSVRIPVPHSHYYHAQNDKFEDELMEYWEWKWSPLQPSDE
ncbi:hypothetical protein AB4Y96_11935 [Phyllobacterium sp. TAF24]|uniref:hypothetical protein n=1 Tax=Phyllobacterium sp. TAF24 TaxID=3233068 RepID=UPI003F9C4CAB